MVQWTNEDANTGAPKYVTDATTGRTGVQEYGNTVFGHTPGEVVDGAGSPGWVRVVKGQGAITDILIVDGGTGYANGETASADDVDAEITTDANGTIVSLDVTLTGSLIDAVPSVTTDTVAGDDATFAVVTNGKIGRNRVETLVAMRGMDG